MMIYVHEKVDLDRRFGPLPAAGKRRNFTYYYGIREIMEPKNHILHLQSVCFSKLIMNKDDIVREHNHMMEVEHVTLS